MVSSREPAHICIQLKCLKLLVAGPVYFRSFATVLVIMLPGRCISVQLQLLYFQRTIVIEGSIAPRQQCDLIEGSISGLETINARYCDVMDLGPWIVFFLPKGTATSRDVVYLYRVLYR